MQTKPKHIFEFLSSFLRNTYLVRKFENESKIAFSQCLYLNIVINKTSEKSGNYMRGTSFCIKLAFGNTAVKKSRYLSNFDKLFCKNGWVINEDSMTNFRRAMDRVLCSDSFEQKCATVTNHKLRQHFLIFVKYFLIFLLSFVRNNIPISTF